MGRSTGNLSSIDNFSMNAKKSYILNHFEVAVYVSNCDYTFQHTLAYVDDRHVLPLCVRVYNCTFILNMIPI